MATRRVSHITELTKGVGADAVLECVGTQDAESPEDQPGKVFDLTLPLDQVAEGYRAMDERRAIKTLLRP